MTRDELLEKLKALIDVSVLDPESAHYEADALLLKFINDKEIEDAFEEIGKWYS